MTHSVKKHVIFSSLVLAASLSSMTYAAQPKEGFTFTPSFGFISTDSSRHLSDDSTYALSVGYQTNTPWSAEATYLHSDLSHKGRGVNMDQYRLDGIYTLPEYTSSQLKPYLAAGLGNNYYTGNSDVSDSNTFINAGGGVKYDLSSDLALRADFRLTKDLTNTNFDTITSVGVQYNFGKPAGL